MNKTVNSKWIAVMKQCGASAAALALVLIASGAARAQAPASSTNATANSASSAINEKGKFYCNVAALNPAERAHQNQLTAKLLAVRTDVIETQKGYEFQFSPSTITLAELADWVAAEGKCCPFFDFHIDLENQGTLLCLRLTGEEGIKEFIRSALKLPPK